MAQRPTRCVADEGVIKATNADTERSRRVRATIAAKVSEVVLTLAPSQALRPGRDAGQGVELWPRLRASVSHAKAPTPNVRRGPGENALSAER